ncbi:5'-nucleotidase [Flavobacterium silvaticum]|uniref:5'-nucleotidase n=1 Tax=Flavobacterium silvaticum TaxID=1852020 RepID=UPI00293C021B|nr:5'-nucleotidase [Flavobacterium silvaticum]
MLRRFVLFLTFASCCILSGCSSSVTQIKGSNFAVTEKAGSSSEIDKFIKPYRDKIDADMNTVLAFAPQTIDKSGKLQTPIGNLFADMTLESARFLLSKRENKTVDFCLLNAGGVRSIIPKGNVTTRVAYEIMPFDNNLIVVELKGQQVQELLEYFASEKKPHPIAGIHFDIKDGKPENVFIGSVPFDNNRNYTVATSDYLYNGGDNMLFFKKAVAKYDLDYKLRNVLIDYFEKNDTIVPDASERVHLIN